MGCGSPPKRSAAPTPVLPSREPAGEPPPAASTAPPPHAPNTDQALNTWLQARLPKGGSLEGGKLMHAVQPGDNAKLVASAYLELTEVYHARDLEKLLQKQAWIVGTKIEIPKPLTQVPPDPEKDRLPMPADQALRGVFLTGPVAAQDWAKTIENLEARGLNAVVLDGKDYMGPITYPTQAHVAVETKANAKPVLPNLARTIRYAHRHNIHVIMRNSCFHDPWTSKRAPRLSLKYASTGAPITAEWLDPTNDEAQNYILDLVKEQVAAGADEIQLDYVRFPVHLSSSLVRFPPQAERSKVILGFVKRVHEITQANHMTLSLDLFGVAATGIRDDIEKLGQDIAVVSQEAEAISPMVYPSHYSKGYNGWENPGDHAEIVGIGTKAALDQLKKAGLPTVVRSWIQAFPYKTPGYNAAYVVAQTKHAEANGGKGWLMWNPGSEYSIVWKAFPVLK